MKTLAEIELEISKLCMERDKLKSSTKKACDCDTAITAIRNGGAFYLRAEAIKCLITVENPYKADDSRTIHFQRGAEGMLIPALVSFLKQVQKDSLRECGDSE